MFAAEKTLSTYSYCRRALRLYAVRCTRGDNVNKRSVRHQSKAAFKSHYEILQVGRLATQEEIRSQFIKLSKECHPDVSSNKEASHDKFVRINEAYNVLSKPQSRRHYDATLQYGNLFRHPVHPRNYRPHGEPFRPKQQSYGKGYTEYKEYADPRDYYQFRREYRKRDHDDTVALAALSMVLSIMCFGVIFHYIAFSTSSRLSSAELDAKDRRNYMALYEARLRSHHHGNVYNQLEHFRGKVSGLPQKSSNTSEENEAAKKE